MVSKSNYEVVLASLKSRTITLANNFFINKILSSVLQIAVAHV